MLGISHVVVLLTIVLASVVFTAADNAQLREDFNTLAQWEPLYFPKISQHSTYTVEKETTDNWVLKTRSNASASGFIWKRTYSIFDYPRLHWRWKVENVYKNGDATKKSGDDYPLRVYVIFKYDQKHASWWKQTKYQTARILYGKYPPDSTVNYIWANRSHGQRILTSPYTDSAKLIVLQEGSNNAHQWVEESVNVLDDYRSAFGHDPLETASLAVMNDSDNTGESSTSYLDFIEVLPR